MRGGVLVQTTTQSVVAVRHAKLAAIETVQAVEQVPTESGMLTIVQAMDLVKISTPEACSRRVVTPLNFNASRLSVALAPFQRRLAGTLLGVGHASTSRLRPLAVLSGWGSVGRLGSWRAALGALSAGGGL